MKRKIDFVSKTRSRVRTYSQSVRLNKFKTFRLTKHCIKTDTGYIDVTVQLDRWGRLQSVAVERSERV